MANNDSNEDMALRAVSPDSAVAASPYGFGDAMNYKNHEMQVVDIKSAWSPDHREIGWLYKASDGHFYWQENLASRPVFSAQISKRIGHIKGLPSASVSAGVSTSSNHGPLVRLNPHIPIREQLPEDTQLLEGFNKNRSENLPHEGYYPDSSPLTIGDQFPNGTRHGTSVVDMNRIMKGSDCTGWVYLGADGHKYIQRNYDGALNYSLSLNLGPVSMSIAPGGVGGINRIRHGDLCENEHLVPGSDMKKPPFHHLLSEDRSLSPEVAPSTRNISRTSDFSDRGQQNASSRGYDPNVPYYPLTPHERKVIAMKQELNGYIDDQYRNSAISYEHKGEMKAASDIHWTGKISMDEKNIYLHDSAGKIVISRLDVLANSQNPEMTNRTLNQALVSGETMTLNILGGNVDLRSGSMQDRRQERGYDRGLG